ncbi:hypothetical protein mRhiFer1_008657 [Rhinolophus ferrumequinum]|uniref:Uncharacterized protein n=1 Tax=Rhinolophus ferrumequinum TaxID=59479 RepID=A0A7J7U139_RHIFE|nr:hypothetical protein mRhiFer1_008657 [Rhinolophus ferrumequinum]
MGTALGPQALLRQALGTAPGKRLMCITSFYKGDDANRIFIVSWMDVSLEILPHGLDVPVAQRSSHDGRGSSLCLCALGHFIQEKMHSPSPDITPVCWGLEKESASSFSLQAFCTGFIDAENFVES